jgi:hypothetical protein
MYTLPFANCFLKLVMRSCSLLYIARDLELANRLVRTIGRIGGQRRKSRDKSINIYLKCEDSEKNRNECVLALCFFLRQWHL